jgi:hypothetical protein
MRLDSSRREALFAAATPLESASGPEGRGHSDEDRFDDLFPDSEAKRQAEREGRPFFPVPPAARRQ